MENTNDNNTRRVRIRRGRSASFTTGGASNSTRLESLRSSAAESDEVDAAIDPDQIRSQIITQVRSVPAPSTQIADTTGDTPNPRERMGQVAMSGSQEYAIEYRLNLLHRMLMRKVPLDQIAQQLGVSVSTVQKDRIKLKARLRESAKALDINELIGGQTELYDEITGMSMRMASDKDTPAAMKLAAMRTTLAANADKTRFLTSTGVLDVLRFRRPDDGSNQSDIAKLMESTDEMLATLFQESTDPAPSRVPAPDKGFGGFTETEGSSADNETEEL